MKKIKLMIADDHCLFRQGLISLIEDFKDMEVIGDAENGKILIEKIKKQKPDIVLMDLNMPIIDGMEATRYIKEKYPDIKIIILTMHDDEKFILHLIETGVNAYLLKNAEFAEVETTIKKVMKDGYFFNEHVNKIIHQGYTNRRIKPTFNTEPDFTPQELNILKLICVELTIQEISDKIHLSPRTVEGYRQKILKKTNAKNTAGIVKFAMREGLIN